MGMVAKPCLPRREQLAAMVEGRAGSLDRRSSRPRRTAWPREKICRTRSQRLSTTKRRQKPRLTLDVTSWPMPGSSDAWSRRTKRRVTWVSERCALHALKHAATSINAIAVHACVYPCLHMWFWGLMWWPTATSARSPFTRTRWRMRFKIWRPSLWRVSKMVPSCSRSSTCWPKRLTSTQWQWNRYEPPMILGILFLCMLHCVVHKPMPDKCCLGHAGNWTCWGPLSCKRLGRPQWEKGSEPQREGQSKSCCQVSSSVRDTGRSGDTATCVTVDACATSAEPVPVCKRLDLSTRQFQWRCGEPRAGSSLSLEWQLLVNVQPSRSAAQSSMSWLIICHAGA